MWASQLLFIIPQDYVQHLKYNIATFNQKNTLILQMQLIYTQISNYYSKARRRQYFGGDILLQLSTPQVVYH